jgi:hypothetical protein
VGGLQCLASGICLTVSSIIVVISWPEVLFMVDEEAMERKSLVIYGIP